MSIYRIWAADQIGGNIDWASRRLMFDSSLPEPQLLDPVLTTSLNAVPSLTFRLNPGHRYAGTIKPRITWLHVEEDGGVEPLFVGRALEPKRPDMLWLDVLAEGDLALFNDSIQPGFEWAGPPSGLIGLMLANHNNQMDPARRIGVGQVSSDLDPNDYIVRAVLAAPWPSTLDKLTDATCDSATGGYLSVAGPIGARVLNWTSTSGPVSAQGIVFGENLLEFTETVSGASLATACEPFGAVIEPAEDEEYDPNRPEERVTVDGSVTGATWLYDDHTSRPHYGAADHDVEVLYGRVIFSETWDDVHDPDNLIRRAQTAVDERKLLSVTMTAAAIDAHLVDGTKAAWRVGQQVPFCIPPLGINNQPMTAVEMKQHLADPSQSQISFGAQRSTLAGTIAKTVKDTAGAAATAGQAVRVADRQAGAVERVAGQVAEAVIELDGLDKKLDDTAGKLAEARQDVAGVVDDVAEALRQVDEAAVAVESIGVKVVQVAGVAAGAQATADVAIMDAASAAAAAAAAASILGDGRINLCPIPRATQFIDAFGNSAAQWGGTAPTVTRSAEKGTPSGGGWVHRYTAAAAFTSGADYAACVRDAFRTFPRVVPSEVHTFSIYVRPSIQVLLRAQAQYINTSGSGQTPANGPDVTCPAGVWTRLWVTGTAPAAATFVYFDVDWVKAQALPAGFTLDVDAFMMEPGPILGPFIGPEIAGTTLQGSPWTTPVRQISTGRINYAPLSRCVDVGGVSVGINPLGNVAAAQWGGVAPAITRVAATGTPSGAGFVQRATLAAAATTPSGDQHCLYQSLWGTSTFSFKAGETVTISLYVRPSAVVQLRAGIYVYNISGGGAAHRPGPTTVTCPANVWTRISATVTETAATIAWAIPHMYWATTSQNLPAGFTLDVDAILIEKASTVGTYFDGEIDGCEWIPGPIYARTAVGPAMAGVPAIYHSSLPPSMAATFGSTWFQHDTTTGNVIAQWNQTAPGVGQDWQSAQLDNKIIANLDAGKITAGTLDAARIGANAITTDKLAAGAVTAAKIAAATITAAEIKAGAIEAVHIKAGAVTTDAIAANAITAVKIAAGTITGDKLAVRSITADKIVIGSTANLIPDPGFVTVTDAALTSLWSLGAGITVDLSGYDGFAALTRAPNQAADSDCIWTGGKSAWVDRGKAFNVSASPGEQYEYSVRVKSSAALTATCGNLRLVVIAQDSTYVYPQVNFPASVAANTWILVRGVMTIPATKGSNVFIAPVIRLNANVPATLWASMPILRRMNEGSLIVDGAIDGKTITGATIQTVATANRGIKITSAELAAWDASGNKTISINATTGAVDIVGALKTSTTATKNVEISPTAYGGYPGIYMGMNSDQSQPTIGASAIGNGGDPGSLILFGSEQTQNSSGSMRLELKQRGQGFKIYASNGPIKDLGVELASNGTLDLRGTIATDAGGTSMFTYQYWSGWQTVSMAGDFVWNSPTTRGKRIPFPVVESVEPCQVSVSNLTTTGCRVTIKGTGANASATVHVLGVLKQ